LLRASVAFAVSIDPVSTARVFARLKRPTRVFAS
jgi:hypothetical protein